MKIAPCGIKSFATDPLSGAAVNLSSKISLWVSAAVLVILGVGNWVIWDQLGTPELQRTHVLLDVWTMVGLVFTIYLVVHRLTRPLTELTRLATQLGAGQLQRRVNSDGRDEIGQLARALDGMSRSLGAARQDLEREVAMRTDELKTSQAQLLQAARMAAVGELAAGVAHEINNPAGIILLRTAELSQNLAPTETEAREDLHVIQRQVDKIRHIVTALLTFSRRAESAGEMTVLDVNQVVLRTAQLMDGFLRSRHVEVELALAPDLPRVRAEGARIEQVLLNLVNNAVDAMPTGGRITFGSAYVNNRVTVFVADTGIGMDEARIDRVFDPFYTTKNPGEGTGLGLTISFAIIEQHGGAIEASSVPGEGSRFTLQLPAAPEGGLPPEAPDVE
ncbi:MAG: ATP-binding protein [bacterium]|nr:ATP-binding protein [bacterium]